MASKALVVLAIQAVLLQAAFASCINRLPIGVSETILPNQVILPQPCNQIPQISTIVQDSSVANNLANALQLLVVSNLLSNTLPVPEYAPVEVIQNLPGYGYNGVELINGLPLSSCGCNAPVSSCGCGAPLLSSCGCSAPLLSSCGCNDVYSLGPIAAPGYSYIY